MRLEHLLLGVLLEHPRTGYDLKKYLDSTGRFLRSNTQMSQVYRSLTKMEDDGWVTYEIEQRARAQAGKVYRATDAGATVFLDWLKGPYHPPSRFSEPEFVVRLNFAGFLEPAEIIDLLDTELRARRDQVTRYRDRDRSFVADPIIPFDRDMATRLRDAQHIQGSKALDAHIAWCEDLRASLSR